MKGILKRIAESHWVIEYKDFGKDTDGVRFVEGLYNTALLPLHPDEIENCKTPLTDYMEVEFEIVEEGNGTYYMAGQKGVQESTTEYAKLLVKKKKVKVTEVDEDLGIIDEILKNNPSKNNCNYCNGSGLVPADSTFYDGLIECPRCHGKKLEADSWDELNVWIEKLTNANKNLQHFNAGVLALASYLKTMYLPPIKKDKK
jgi:hypothetical protein